MIKIIDIKGKKIPSIEREIIVYELWNSGKYGTRKDLGQELELSAPSISDLLYAYSIRKRLINNSITNLISTRTIIDSRGLSEGDKRKVYEMIANKIMIPDEVRGYARKIKKSSRKKKFVSSSASSASSSASSASKIIKIQKKTDSQKKIENKITLFQNITFKVMNRLRFNIIKDLPKWAKDECKSLLLMIVRHCQEVLEELNQIYPLNKRGEIIEIN